MEANDEAPPAWDGVLRDCVLLVALLGLLAVVFLSQLRPAPPSWGEPHRIAGGFIVFALLAMGLHVLLARGDVRWATILVMLVGAVGLLELIARFGGDAFPPGAPAPLVLVAIAGSSAAFLIAYPDPRGYTPAQWGAIASFAVVAALFLFHTRPVYAGRSPTWPIWAVLVAGINVLVIPRFVPERVFLWAVGVLAALPSAAAIVARFYGEFTVASFEITRRNVAMPFLYARPDGWYSIMPAFGTNVFGLIAFAGLAAATFLVHRRWVERDRLGTGVAGVLVGLNGVGLLLSSSDASWIAAAVTLGCFLTFIIFGRGAIAPVLTAGVVVGALGMAAVYGGVLPIDAGGRFDRWRSGIRAFRADPTLLGLGHVSTADVTAPYLETMPPNEPHNSYLDILLRTGLVGVAAYVLLLVGAIVEGALRAESVNRAMLAFTVGWAVHQLFESYSMVQTTIPAVLAALTLGYLVFGFEPGD